MVGENRGEAAAVEIKKSPASEAIDALLAVLDKGTNREQRLSAESFSDDAGQGLRVAVVSSLEDSAREYRIYLPENTVHRKTEQGNWLALNLDEADASPFVADIHKAAVGISHFL